MESSRYVIFILIFILCLESVLNAQNKQDEKQSKTASEVVTEIYNLVSFKAGETPDWDKVKSLFIDEAVIVFKRVIDWSPHFIPVYTECATMLEEQGRFDEAMDIINRARRKAPDNERIRILQHEIESRYRLHEKTSRRKKVKYKINK